MAEFREYLLESICDRLSSGKNIKAAEVFESGKYPVYGGNGLRGYSEKENFSGECAIIGRQGAYCGNVRYFSGTAYMTEHAVVVQANDNHNTRYLSYLLEGMQLGRLSGQSAQPGLSVKVLGQQIVLLPDKKTQDKVAGLIASLENKINTNNKINRNLSEQMQAIFGSIFYPEMEAGNKASLGEYLYIKGRIGWKGLKKDEYLSESDFRIINGESLTISGIDWNKAGYISEERYEESPEIMLQEGDILISKDGTIGKIGYVNKLDKPTSVASGIFVIRNLKPDEVSTVFIYCLLTSDYFKSFIASRTEGSVIPHLYQKDFVTLELPILSQEQIELFNSTVVPLFELYFFNQTENNRLATLRDSLLPKLMSGELAVSDLDI